MKASKNDLKNTVFSRGDARPPAALPIRLRISAEQYANLSLAATVLAPASRGNTPGGLAEMVRRSLDAFVQAPADPGPWARVEGGRDTSVSFRLSADEVASLDRLWREGGWRGRGHLVRQAIDAYLRTREVRRALREARSREAEKG